MEALLLFLTAPFPNGKISKTNHGGIYMPKSWKSCLLPGISYVLSLVSALFWVALRINYSGISKFLGADFNQSFLIMNLPVMVCVLSWAGFLLAFFGLVLKKKWASLAGLIIGSVTALGALVVVYFGAWDYLNFIGVHFLKSIAGAVLLHLLAGLLFFPVVKKTKTVLILKWAVLTLAVLGMVIWGYQLRPCRFTYGAVVYAVEDDYQIVFSTSDSAMAWVTIDGIDYYDLYAGSARSKDRVHKVTVPQSALDAAGSYTTSAQQMIYRGPFGGYKGKTLSRSYDFRPVDPSDGLNYAALSDVHGAAEAAAKAASDDKLDFLVLIGDMVDMVETEKDAQFPNKLAHAVTKGSFPVIYARGNHEIKGEYTEVLYKYVGSKNQNFYYTVTLGDSVFAAVLDMGEDHEDNWWEYYGTAKFSLYRQEQSRMLEEALAEGSYRCYPYRMAICHVPIVHIDKHGYFEASRLEWTELLNQMEMDISLSGHEHRVWFFLPDTLEPGEAISYSPRYDASGKTPGGTVTDFRFPAFLVGQRSRDQFTPTQKMTTTDYLCLHTSVNLEAGTQVNIYRNSFGEILPMEYPFACEGSLNESALTEIITDLQ